MVLGVQNVFGDHLDVFWKFPQKMQFWVPLGYHRERVLEVGDWEGKCYLAVGRLGMVQGGPEWIWRTIWSFFKHLSSNFQLWVLFQSFLNNISHTFNFKYHWRTTGSHVWQWVPKWYPKQRIFFEQWNSKKTHNSAIWLLVRGPWMVLRVQNVFGEGWKFFANFINKFNVGYYWGTLKSHVLLRKPLY